MELFITGGTGYIGQAAARREIGRGHQVTALVREETSANDTRAGAADRVEFWPLDEARKSLGAFADALALDQTISGQHARRVLAWEPHGPGLIADPSGRKHFQQSNGA